MLHEGEESSCCVGSQTASKPASSKAGGRLHAAARPPGLYSFPRVLHRRCVRRSVLRGYGGEAMAACCRCPPAQVALGMGVAVPAAWVTWFKVGGCPSRP